MATAFTSQDPDRVPLNRDKPAGFVERDVFFGAKHDGVNVLFIGRWADRSCLLQPSGRPISGKRIGECQEDDRYCKSNSEHNSIPFLFSCLQSDDMGIGSMKGVEQPFKGRVRGGRKQNEAAAAKMKVAIVLDRARILIKRNEDF